MLKIMILFSFILSPSVFGMTILPVSVKDRLRLDLWYNGIEKNQNLVQKTKTQLVNPK